jgi:hypothetical protein
MPLRLDLPPWPGTVTCAYDGLFGDRDQRWAAESWDRAAFEPQAKTAAIHFPSWLRSVWPTA